MQAQSDFPKDIAIIIKGGFERLNVPKKVSREYDNTNDSL